MSARYDRAVSEPETETTPEVVDGLPVLAGGRAVKPVANIAPVAVQAAAAAGAGLAFGAAVIAAFRGRRSIDGVRVFALGVKPAYQHTGVAARFYQMHFDSAEVTPQTHGEMGWILEINRPMNRAMEGMGGSVVSRYRLYERRFRDDAAPAWPEGARVWGEAS